MSRYEYKGIAYRQGIDTHTPWIISFVAPAEELLDWAGIPRRSDANLTGFQRAFDPVRVDRAKEFLSHPKNISPTALVVGLHPGSPTTTLDLKFIDGGDVNASTKVRECILTVEFDEAIQSDALAAIVSTRLDIRLSTDTGQSNGAALRDYADEGSPEDDEDDNEEDDVFEADDDEAGGDSNRGVEVSHSVMRSLRAKLDDADWVKANREHLIDLCKPGTIIDGQHRVKGAEGLERGLPFAVCAIWECEWSEQVFQFTVVNYTARGIPDQFITANAALSLTEGELGALQSRLVQAGVKVVEYELMRVVHWDESSAFYQNVNVGEKQDATKIGYKTMVKMAKQWYSANHTVFKMILPKLYPNISGRGTVGKRREQWQEGDWGEFLLSFWSVVKDQYADEPSHEAGSHLWDVGKSQLMTAVVILEFQEAFFTNLNAQDEAFFEVPDDVDPKAHLLTLLRKRAKTFSGYIPSTLFATKWGVSSLNTSLGRRALHDMLREMVDTKGRYQYGGHPLVTGRIAE